MCVVKLTDGPVSLFKNRKPDLFFTKIKEYTKPMLKKQKIQYKIELNIQKDGWNWYIICNQQNTSHGVNWAEKIPKEIYDSIKNKTEEEAHKFIISFLNEKYISKKKEIQEFTNLVNSEYQEKFDLACQKIVELQGKPIYRNDFTIFLTTAPRAPYSYEKGTIWLPIGWSDPIKIFMHELSHFQFIHYWRINNSSEVSKLNNAQFEFLKESLTVILDESLIPLIKTPDKGYELHKNFRTKLHNFWENNKNFDKLVEFGLSKLNDFVK